jgi:hypothetical protein
MTNSDSDKATPIQCPFCGTHKTRIGEDHVNACPLKMFVDIPDHLFKGAYCWKERDALLAENESLKKKIEELERGR